MTHSVRRVAALILWTLSAASVAAHHSFDAEYDSNKPITITGVVTKIDWANPHAFVYLDAKATSGEVKRYKIEMGPPYALVRGGWKRDTLKIGDTVTVENAALAKDGSDAAGSMPSTQMRLSSGQKLTMR
jgi:uncharacterized protein DUF6152